LSKSARPDSIAAQHVVRIIARHLDGEFAVGLAAIDPEMRELRVQDAVPEGGIHCGRCKAGVADIEFGRRHSDLGIDVVQSDKIDRLVAPGACALRSCRLAAGRRAEVEALEVDVDFYARLAGEIGRGRAVELPAVQRAAQAVDREHRAVRPQLCLGGQRPAEKACGVQHQLDRNILPLHRSRGQRGFDVEFQRMFARSGVACESDLPVRAC
jgi:hypothetical protein